jgi:hypothetical protein
VTMGLLALAALALAVAGFANLLAPVERPSGEHSLLRGEQRRLLARADESDRFIAEQEHLLAEIGRLQQMMREVDPELYRARLARLDDARVLLREQIRVERELMREYEKTQRILEVEMETVRVVGRLEEDVMQTIEQRLAELDAAREANRDMRFQLEANEEVERILGGSSGL